jgi:hypothetical protein
VYAVYNIAYSIGMMAVSGFASLASSRLTFLQILLCVSLVLMVGLRLILSKASPVPAAAAPDALTSRN